MICVVHSFILPYKTALQEWKQAVRYCMHHHIPPKDTSWKIIEGVSSGVEPFEATSFSIPRPIYELACCAIQSQDPNRFLLVYQLIWTVCTAQPNHTPSSYLNEEWYKKLLQRAEDVQKESFALRRSLVFHSTKIQDMPFRIGYISLANPILLAHAAFIAQQNPGHNWAVFSPQATIHTIENTLYLQERQCSSQTRHTIPEFSYFEEKTREFLDHLQDDNFSEETSSIPFLNFEKNQWKSAFPPPSLLSSEISVSITDISDISIPFPVPPLDDCATQAAECKRCSLYKPATQTVFGEGNPHAALMLIGEQPGDQEDKQNRPFVGPAGNILNHAIIKAGFKREDVYLTNAVKHFKFKNLPQRRLHQTPDSHDILSCKIWLELERQNVKPKFILLLGSTAAKSVLKRPVAILKERSQPFQLPNGTNCMITVHPSYLLRLADDRERKKTEYFKFVDDLKTAYQMACNP